MPLARILTRYPEQAGALSNELRQHGYTVEFSSPEAAGKPPADLEIDFEICAESDALNRASELADSLHTDVAVSPGVLVMPQRVVEEPVIENPAEQVTAGSFARNDDVTVQGPPIAALEDITPQLDRAVQEQEAAQFAALESVPVAEAPSEQREPAQPIAAMEELPEAEEPQMQQQAAAHITIPADMLPESHSFTEPAPTVFDDELEIARAAAPSQSASENSGEFLTRAGEKSAAALEGAALASKELWSAARDKSQDLWASVREKSAEYREQLRVQRAEKEAERQYKLLQLEKRREMAEERAAELEAARQAAAVRLQELLRERGALTEAQPAPPQKVEVPVVASIRAVETIPAWRRLLAKKITLPFSRTYRPEVEAILMGVAAACAFVVLGLAVASFHARPAISNSFSQPATTTKGVTVQSGGVTVKAGAPAAAASQPIPTQPTVARTQTTQKPAAAVRERPESDVTVRHFPAAAKPSAGRGSSGKNVADDVVIRHFGAQAKPTAQAAPEPGLKHYSDLDN